MMKKPQSKFSKTAGKTATRRTPKKNRRGLRKTAGFCGFPAGLAALSLVPNFSGSCCTRPQFLVGLVTKPYKHNGRVSLLSAK